MKQDIFDLDLVNGYREKYVDFLDLLGFREVAKKVSKISWSVTVLSKL